MITSPNLSTLVNEKAETRIGIDSTTSANIRSDNVPVST